MPKSPSTGVSAVALRSKSVSGIRHHSGNVRARILQAADRLFFTYGIRSVSMDDLCRELSISKKTLYQYFKDKDELVHVLLMQHIRRQRRDIHNMERNAADPVEHSLKARDFMTQEMQRFHARYVYDLQKYFPRSWEHFRRFTRNELTEVIARNLRKGCRLGLYRADLPVAIISRMRIEQIFLAANPVIYPPEQFRIQEVQLALWQHFMLGILTEKGLALMLKHSRAMNKSRKNSTL